MKTTLTIAGAAALLTASRLAAQTSSPDAATFYLLLGKDTIVAEHASRTATELQGEMIDRLRGGRVVFVAALAPDASISRLATRAYRPGLDSAGEIATFQPVGVDMNVTLGNGQTTKLPSLAGALPILNPSTAFIEQVVRRAKVLAVDGNATVVVYVAGSSAAVRASATFIGRDSVSLAYGGVAMRLAIDDEGRVLGGVVPAQNVRIVRTPGSAPLAAAKRDYSAPADAPYVAEDVVVTTKEGLRLTGTLTLPKDRPRGRVPAVVTITGSGSEDRDEQSAALPAYRPFREIADTLGRRGIAVLRLDDRGINGSDLGPVTATSADFANDIRAGVAYLRTRREIDSTKIALLGHSEGGLVAPMVAQTDKSIRALVLMASPASPGAAILKWQQRYVVDSVAHITGALRDSALAQYQRNTDAMAAQLPWMRWFLEHDPVVVARQITGPAVLILQGENDRQVPPSEAGKLAQAFLESGNRRVDTMRFSRANHLFVTDTIGGFAYEKLPSLAVQKDVLGAIAKWLTDVFR